MKPKHRKTIRHKRQNQSQRRHHHNCTNSIDSKGVSVEIDNSELDDKDQEPLAQTFDMKCSTKPSTKHSVKSKLTIKKVDSDDTDDDSEWETEKYNELFQSVKERKEQLVDRLRIYNNLFKFHKTIKEEQVYLYRKLQEMDELYLRNTAVILKLGFCPCLVHQQTSPVGDLLMKIHRKLRVWDKKMEEICEILKEPSTRKTTTAVLQILKVGENVKFRQDQVDFNDIALPDIVWDLNNPFLEQLNSSKLPEDWDNVKTEILKSLCKGEFKFQEICLEFGITRGPAQTPSYDTESRMFTYENISMNPDSDEVSNNDQPSDKDVILDGAGDESSGVDTPGSKLSSSL